MLIDPRIHNRVFRSRTSVGAGYCSRWIEFDMPIGESEIGAVMSWRVAIRKQHTSELIIRIRSAVACATIIPVVENPRETAVRNDCDPRNATRRACKRRHFAPTAAIIV